jgi:peptidoglycan/xylan/chitin deacetylase (PgdA/CDA1 family)
VSVPRAVKHAVAWGLARSGALSAVRVFAQRRTALILMYHRVNDAGDPFFPALPSGELAAHVDYLRGRYALGTFDEVAAWLESGAPGPPRAAITFDDGYPDTFEVVLPLLRARGVPATLFLSTAPPETGRPLWLDRVRALFRGTQAPMLDSPALGAAGWPLTDQAARLRALGRVAGALKYKGRQELADAEGDLERRLGPAAPEHVPGVLSWAQVAQLAEGGIAIAAHTHDHHILSTLSAGEAREDVGRSVDLIRERLGTRPRSFAYPNGRRRDYGAEGKAVLAELGIRWACTTTDGFARPESDPLELPRLYGRAETVPLFGCRMAGLARTEAPS